MLKVVMKNNFVSCALFCLLLFPTPAISQILPPFQANPKPVNPLPLEPDATDKSIEIDPFDTQQPIQNEFPTLTIKSFNFVGNTISDKDLTNLLLPYIGKKIGIEDLINIRNTINKFYVDKGYTNSGSLITVQDNQNVQRDNAILTIRIIEGTIETIQVEGSKRLEGYIKKRLGVDSYRVFNSLELEKSLSRLSNDTLIKKISGTIEAGSYANTSILKVNVEPENPYDLRIFLDNHRSPSVGTFQRGVDFTALNPFQIGDSIRASYSNTQGSDLVQFNYSVPINSSNTELGFTYSYGKNTTIEKPFNTLDILGNSHTFQLDLRQPIVQHFRQNQHTEFLLGLSVKHQRIQDSIAGFSYPVSRGSDAKGRTRTTVLSFNQELVFQDIVQAAQISSQFNVGIPLGSTTDPLFKDGQFFSWQGSATWVHKLPWDLHFTARLKTQIANKPLVAAEEFAIGGVDSLLGYRNAAVLGDNGIFGNVSVTIPVYEGKAGKFTVSPILGLGCVWENFKTKNFQTLASAGLALDYAFNERLSANLSWGFPLIDINQGTKKSLQDNGILLSIIWRIF